MTDQLETYRRSSNREYHYTVLIPTWNNLPYLKTCLEGLRSHSGLPHQVIVFVNEGSDGTLDWLQGSDADNLDFIYSDVNLGICYGVNLCRDLIRSDYLIYMNDDMYPLPGWDTALFDVVQRMDTQNFMLSSTMIEPVRTANRCVIVSDYGRDIESFRKEQLLHEFRTFQKEDWQGSTWPPVMVHRTLWDMVGGFSPEFTPGHYSDPDLSFKLLKAGLRIFRGVGASRVYHFGSKSTGRIKRNNGRMQFLYKYGISSHVFSKKLLKMGSPFSGPLSDVPLDLHRRPWYRFKKWFYF